MIDIRPLDPHLRVMIARFHHGKGLAMAHNYRRVEASPVITSFVFLCHSLSSFDSCHQPPLTCVILCLMLHALLASTPVAAGHGAGLWQPGRHTCRHVNWTCACVVFVYFPHRLGFTLLCKTLLISFVYISFCLILYSDSCKLGLRLNV